MSAIIAAILAAVGPLIAEALYNWLKSLFNKAAKKLEGRSFGTPAQQAVALCNEAIALTKPREFGKRIFLRHLRDNAATVVNGFELPANVVGEIKDAAEVAK